MSINDAIGFFTEHAGYAVRPGESEDSARERAAVALAEAEREAASRGWFTAWEIDTDADTVPGDDYFVSGNPQWVALLRDPEGDLLASLSGIDFETDHSGPGTDPRTEPYARVVSAELASQAISERDD